MKGRNKILERLIQKYYHQVYQFILIKVGAEPEAKDIIQDVFLDFIHIYSRNGHIKDPRAYLLSMAKNAIIKNSKSIKTVDISTINESATATSAAATCFEKKLESKDLLEKLEEFIFQLPCRQREVFILSRKNGLTHNEIAQELNLSSHTVNNHLVQALKSIRAQYSQLYP